MLLTSGIDWPPNLAKFISLCKNIDTSAAFNRMIKRHPPLDNVEYATRNEVGFQCRTQLAEEKARKLFNETYTYWHDKQSRGEQIPDMNQKKIQAQTGITEIDKIITNRINSNNKTSIELRMESIRKGKNQI